MVPVGIPERETADQAVDERNTKTTLRLVSRGDEVDYVVLTPNQARCSARQRP